MSKRVLYTWVAFFSVFLLTQGNHVLAKDVVFEEIKWIDLIPEDDLQALMNPPEFLLNITDGSAEDNLDTLAKESETSEKAKRFSSALKSERVIDSFNGRNVKIPGFIVPLSTNEEREVVDFFIVPYFGACLHMPPPPPNQIIFASWPEGILVNDLSAPMWFEGKVNIETRANEMGISAYAIALDNLKPY